MVRLVASLLVLVGLTLVGLGVPGRCRSQAPERYELVWTAPDADSCPGAPAVAAEIAVRLRRNPFSHGTEQAIQVELGGEPGEWSAAISVRHADGTISWSRALESREESCYTLADAIVLSIVLMIDPAAVALAPEVVEPQQSPIEPTAPDAGTVVASPPEDSDTLRSRADDPGVDRGRLSASLGASLVGGVLPRLAPGVALRLGGPLSEVLRWGVGMHLYPQVRTSDSDFAFGLTSVSLSLCAEVAPHERLRLGACLSPMVGVIHGVVFEPEPTFPGDRPWLGLSTDAAAALRLAGPLWLRLDVGVLWSLLRQVFTVRGRDEPAFQQDLVGLHASLSLALNFE